MELGEASWDSTGFGEMEEGLILSGGRSLRVPLLTSLGLDLSRITGSLQSRDRRVRSRLVWRNGTPLACRVVHGVTDHLLNCL